MGTLERRERERVQRWESILDAAERVFFSKGVREATMDEVAEAAELSKGTIYLYFKSKQEIYYNINHRALLILRKMFEQVMDLPVPGAEKIREIGRAYYRFSQEYPDYFEAMMHFEAEVLKAEDAGSIGIECHEAGMEVLGLVAESIRQGIADGSLRSDLDPMKTSILLWAQTDGVIRIVARKCQQMKDFANLNPEGLIDDFFGFTYRALRPPDDGIGSKQAGEGAES
jgi:AcrR family transcriptional regulator